MTGRISLFQGKTRGHRPRLQLLLTVLALLLASIAADAQELTFRPILGGFPADSGFALGGSVTQTHFAGPVDARARGIVSIQKYELYEVGLNVPELGRWLSFDIAGRYRNLPQEDFWGIGPNTAPEARRNYLLEDVDTTATLSAHIRRFRVGTSAGFLTINTGNGRDKDFAPVPEDLQSSPRYTHIGMFFRYEALDDAADPHRGGKYSVEWTNYASGFQRYTLEAQRFIPVTMTDRIGLRIQTSFTHSNDNNIPFFMLPFVGGTDTVRGYDHYRFRDRNALVLNAEYRRPLSDFLDVVAFADAGRVFARAQNLGLSDLHPSAGFGARVKFGSNVFFGIDLGFSREGRKLWFRSDQAF